LKRVDIDHVSLTPPQELATLCAVTIIYGHISIPVSSPSTGVVIWSYKQLPLTHRHI